MRNGVAIEESTHKWRKQKIETLTKNEPNQKKIIHSNQKENAIENKKMKKK